MGSRVTTKNGDTGTTRTLSGDVLSKGHVVLECTGRADALRAHTALLRAMIIEREPADHAAVADFLFWLLHVYFLIGTEVNDPEGVHPEYRKDTVGPKHLARLDAEQARIEATLQLPRAFIVSASSVLAAQIDVVATVARDLERELVRLKEAVPVFEAEHLLAFVNRVSDYLYILARYVEQGAHIPVDYAQLER